MRITQDAAIILLGLLSGAMLLIAVTLVGYWQSLDPDAFLTWFARHADGIGALMIPLGGGATLAAVASAAVTWSRGGAPRSWSLLSALLAVLVVIVYLLMHAPRNAAFTAQTVPAERVADELAIWARWHWVRVGLGVAAFWAQVCAARSAS